jgi:hypothetical protein
MEGDFKVIIAGGRDFQDYELLARKCDMLFSNRKPTAIISGLARGADLLGKQYAEERGIPVLEFPANWNKYGKAAGFFRNRQMLNAADALVAFWDGRSHGTKHMIDIAAEQGLPTRVIRYRA